MNYRLPMVPLSIMLFFTLWRITPSEGTLISFISWNVNDNKKFPTYTTEIVSKLLNLNSKNPLPDIYAITLQENCLDCSERNLNKLVTPFVTTLQQTSSANYKLIAIKDTRQSSLCETAFCLSGANMHGTTVMMVLAKSNLEISEEFQKVTTDCSPGFIKNAEKGIAVIGFKLQGKTMCYGGLHLHVSSSEARTKCFIKILDKLKQRCNVMFFGGDFNTRPGDKSDIVPAYFSGGKNESYLEIMKQTDQLSGPKPFDDKPNFLKYIAEKKNMLFSEPFKQAPRFPPTYSINSSLNCKDFPACYEPKRFPAWTDRIIYYPTSMGKCTVYSSIPSLGAVSDHMPVYANCEVS